MPLVKLNEFLERLGEANEGTNHGSEYALYELPDADALQAALDLYFSRLSTSNSPAQPAENWRIRLTPVRDSREAISLLARHWFYEQEYSPRIDPARSEETVSEFMAQLRSVVGDAAVFEVQVAPPMWYDCVWQDFAFDGGSQRWLLHLGFSD
ncbi:MAG TPA: hypothetical protein VH370_23765 [Humisphaera sp.]|jgi:hypothetical protein|nr:hypothetical protein [Humisphaera sp.]